ncbi:MAG: ATP/GTP-binding protein, partial [Anaerolineales bacterium]
MSKVQQLSLHQFMAFDEKTSFEFSPGINVFIGANSTGKSLVMKAIYALLKICETAHRDQIVKDVSRVTNMAEDKFLGVFKPDRVGQLVRRARGKSSGRINLMYDDAQLNLTLTTQNKITLQANPLPNPVSSVFVPAHEFLSTSEGFISAYTKRETAFDETYYDISLALDALPLRGPRLDETKKLVNPLEKAMGGKVIREKNGRFYVKLQEGKIEAPILSEGYRKIAGLIYLLINGSLTQNGILFWDEPEANLNPDLVTVVTNVLRVLAKSGMQIFLATHDYLVSQ